MVFKESEMYVCVNYIYIYIYILIKVVTLHYPNISDNNDIQYLN
jgi:hypothetical protein